MLQASNEQWALTTRRTGLRVWGDQSILIVLNQRCTRAALTIFVSIASFESTSLSKPMGVSRAATGIGPITRATPINALLLEYVAQPTPLDFLETIALIEQAGYIPAAAPSPQRRTPRGSPEGRLKDTCFPGMTRRSSVLADAYWTLGVSHSYQHKSACATVSIHRLTKP